MKEYQLRSYSILTGLFSALLFGMATPASKILLGNINAFQLAGLLYIGGAVGVLPIMLFNFRNKKSDQKISLNRDQFFKITGALFFGGLLGPVFLLFGLKSANASSVSVWLNLELVATAVLGTFFFKDHLDINGWTGVFFTLAAGIIITFSEGQSGGIAVLFVAIACICWGLDNHFTALTDSLSPSAVTFLKGVTAGSVNFIIGIILAPSPQISTLTISLSLGIFSYGLSIVLYVVSSHQLGATRSQILFSTAPFFGIFIAVIFLKEKFIYLHALAMAFIVTGIYFSNRTKHTHEHIHEELTHTHLHTHDDQHHLDHNHIGINITKQHSHAHTHRKIIHSHSHFPDIHHRHEH